MLGLRSLRRRLVMYKEMGSATTKVVGGLVLYCSLGKTVSLGQGGRQKLLVSESISSEGRALHLSKPQNHLFGLCEASLGLINKCHGGKKKFRLGFCESRSCLVAIGC